MSTNPTPRRPRSAKEEHPQQARLAPAFDRDALALSFLCDKGAISRAEFRLNLRLLGVQLEDEEVRRLPVPQVVSIQATNAAFPRETEPPLEEGDELMDPWADDEEES